MIHRNDGIWWPDYDHDPVKCLAFVRKGLTDMDIAARLCKRRRLCIQAGGHVGLWPKRLSTLFDQVHSFEPDPILFSCMKLNVQIDRVAIYNTALGRSVGPATMRRSVSAGSFRVDEGGDLPITMVSIDALNFKRCDAIYLDIEGYEVEALAGGRNTINEYRPIIHVEELPRSKEAIRNYLQRELNYRLVKEVHSDAIYVPTEYR